MIHPILRLLYAPDAAEPAGGASPMTFDVPETPSAATESTVTDVVLDSPVAEAVYGIKGPKEALGDDGVEEMEKMEAQMQGREPRERGPDGKFLPKGAKKEETVADTKKTEAAKPAVKAPAKAAAKPTPVAKAPATPQASAKVKIGDEEKTAEEWAAEIADTRAKAKVAAEKKTEAAAPEPKTEPNPEEIAADEAKKLDDFIAREAKKYEIEPKELDTILSGLEGAAPALAKVLTKVEASTRQWATREFNKVIQVMHDRMQPLIEHQQRIADYQRDNGFLEANPEIKAHPQGYATYQKTKADMENGYKDIEEKTQKGTVTPAEAVWLANRKLATQEQYESSLAILTKEELAKLPAQASPNAAPQRQAAAKPPERMSAVSKPFNGDRPGGGSSPLKTESADARALREMDEAGY